LVETEQKRPLETAAGDIFSGKKRLRELTNCEFNLQALKEMKKRTKKGKGIEKWCSFRECV